MTNRQFIKKLDNYLKMVSEAFDNPLPIRWIDKSDKLIGLFTVYEHIYQINCSYINDGFWIYKFFFYDIEKNTMDPNLTGFEKDKYRVLPTIKDGIIYLIENKDPDCIIYGSLDSSVGKKKIYNQFSIELSKKYNFKYINRGIDDLGEKQIYILYKENIDKDLLVNKTKKVIDDIISTS